MDSVVTALEALLGTVELDETGVMHAAIARALASKLDEARGQDSGAVAMAIAGIAKELRAVIAAITDASAEDDEFVSGLFS